MPSEPSIAPVVPGPWPTVPVITQAARLAKLLNEDPVLAGQLKEHLTPARLLELLDLPSEDLLNAVPPQVIAERWPDDRDPED